MMLMFYRRQRYVLLILLLLSIFVIYKSNQVQRYFFTDEHRIYTSLIAELPRLERVIRTKQFNLSQLQTRLSKVEKRLTKYSWHLNRLIKTIRRNTQEQKPSPRFNSFDFDFDRNQSKFLVYFQFTNISEDLDPHSLHEFHSKLRQIQSPYITFNESDAYLHVVYLPIRSNKQNTCYKNVLDEKFFVLYEFTSGINEQFDEQCFQGKFLLVKFFTQFDLDTDYSRWNEVPQTSIGILYLDRNGKSIIY